MTRRVLALAAAVAVVAVAALLSSGGGSGPTTEDRVRSIASGLRCPVCQNLSVADSPSRLAGEMRGEIAHRLRDGRTDNEIRSFFVARYGEWVLLDPVRRGWNLVPALVPIVAVVVGLGVWLAVLRRRPRGEPPELAEAR